MGAFPKSRRRLAIAGKLVIVGQTRTGAIARTIDTPWQCIGIIFFDLLEQVDLVELIEAFKALRRLLAPRGLIIARFPNEKSPFGRHYQHGDITDKLVL